MSFTQPKEPLAQADPNRQQPQQANPFDMKDAESKFPAPGFEQERKQHESMHARLLKQEQSGKQTGKYVSPSDDMLSPASAKLNAFKEKRINKTIKPRTLFARTPSMSSSTAQGPGSSLKQDERAEES